MQPKATFIDRAAVEAWDAWFRLRDGARLCDTTIECTWRRVAGAVAAGDGPLRDELATAMASWRVLLDERIVAVAGTDARAWPSDPCALVNAAAFVDAPGSPDARFDGARFAGSAALALRALDAATSRPTTRDAVRPALGVTGVADALALLGLRYDGAPALAFVRSLGLRLAEGCFRANVALARKHGARIALTRASRARAIGRGIAGELVADAERHGLRHAGALVLTSQPRLALLANAVADALDPLADDERRVSFPPDRRVVRSHGCARVLLRAAGRSLPGSETARVVSIGAQLALRGALQPWLDAPIDHPVRVARVPTADESARARAQAAWLGLVEPRFSVDDAASGSVASMA